MTVAVAVVYKTVRFSEFAPRQQVEAIFTLLFLRFGKLVQPKVRSSSCLQPPRNVQLLVYFDNEEKH